MPLRIGYQSGHTDFALLVTRDAGRALAFGSTPRRRASQKQATGACADRAYDVGVSRPTAEEFWAVVDERVFELVEAGDMWQAYEIAMEVAGLVFRPE